MKKSKVKYLKCICCEGSFVDAQSLWGMSEEEENEVKEDFRNSICASLIISKKEGTEISCHYGSSLDGSRYQVVKNSYMEGATGDICDACIKKLVDQKEVVLISEDNFW